MEKKKKVCILEVKSFDEKKGQVTFYYGSWNKDRDGDTLHPESVDTTTIENKANIYHNEDHGEVIGVPIEFGKDEKGPWVKSQLLIGDGAEDKGTVAGHEAYSKYKAGAMKGHSMEFVTKKSEKDPQGGRILKNIELWGVTSMTKIPANAEATLISMKNKNEGFVRIKVYDTTKKKMVDCAVERKALADFIAQNNDVENSMAEMIPCENCNALLPQPDNEDDTQMDCPFCGNSVQEKSSSIISLEVMEEVMLGVEKKSFISMDAIDNELELKATFTAAQRKKYAKEGVALPDGSFPIRNAKDLENAIHDIGRASDPAAAKAHIKKRAKELGLEDNLPDAWDKKDFSIVLELKKADGKYIKMRTDKEQAKLGGRVVIWGDPGTVVGRESTDKFNYGTSQMETRDILKVEHPAGTQTYSSNTTVNPSEPFHKFYDAEDVLVHQDDIEKKPKK